MTDVHDPGIADGLDDARAQLAEQQRSRLAYRELRIRGARKHFGMFLELVLRDEETNQPIRLADHHWEWCEIMDKHDRIVLLSAIELGKTNIFTIGRTLWETGLDPSLRTVILGNTETGAKKLATPIKRYIEKSSELRQVFPHMVPGNPWGELAFSVARAGTAKDPTVQCIGMHGSILGARVDRLRADDVIDFENSRTSDGRTDAIKWWSTPAGRLSARGRVTVVGNPWHVEDLYHHLAKQPAYAALTYGVLDPQGEPRWPERWPLERIAKVAAELGLTEADRQLNCRARNDASSKWKQAWIDLALHLGEGTSLCQALNVVPRGYRTYTGVDLAISRKDGSDDTALVSIAVDPYGVRSLLEVQAGKMSGPDIINRAVSAHQRFQSVLVVENNAAQDYIVQFTRLRGAIPIIPYTTGSNKAHPEFGLEGMGATMAGGKWKIPNRGGVVAPEVGKLLAEMLAYDPAAHTGDRLMACVPPGHQVTTRRGLVPIEQVVEGDEVVTHRGRFRRVTGVTCREHRGEIAVLHPAGMPELRVTPEHPVYSAETRLDTAARTNRMIPTEWNFRAPTELRVGKRRERMWLLAPTALWPAMSTRLDLATFTRLRPRKQAWGSRWRVDDAVLQWRKVIVPRWLHVDEELGIFLGLFLAEGHTNNHQASFSFHARETHLADFVAKIVRERFGAATVIQRRPGHGGMSAMVDSVVLARFLSRLGKRASKGLPWEWMGWPLDVRLAVVRGWLLGDGWIAKRATTAGGFLSAVSVAPAIIAQAQLTLRDAGLLSSTHDFAQPALFRGKPVGHLPAIKLVMSTSDSARLLAHPMDVECAHWGRIATLDMRERTNSRSLIVEDGAAVSLADMTWELYDGLVYNMHVDEDESFVVGGVAVHNCWFAHEGARRGNLVAGSQRGRDMMRR